MSEVDILCGLAGNKRIFWFFKYLGCSVGFLSAIFGFLRKFRIDIGIQKNFEIFFRDEIFSQKMCFLKILKIFEKSRNSIGIWIIPFITCYKGNDRNPYRILGFFKNVQNFQKSYFLRKFFHLEKNISKFFWTPMSMQNFPRIPKITLRTPADQAKDAKNAKQEKCTFILYYFPFDPVLGERGSWTFCVGPTSSSDIQEFINNCEGALFKT